MSQSAVKMQSGFTTYTRRGGTELEQPFEKPVIVPVAESKDPAAHAWADARFATDIMANTEFSLPC